ncbi:thiol reductant ABC exporter subunit CydC [Microbacterium amylolyticum]|uniref:ATP-binding cassette subfamily C protein CydCD n=1 Tax=Microbacterium amylolyticum TaxID=936337 RepID=A0ABS4ZI74_9MICO|nr:thiol reductant ABC exporter subunit CydC [Microbacterium amylolyticum]MBP2436733.1 ATP-binding cassette subfamily C protein CydCD [Microbacterium amylolyticum]
MSVDPWDIEAARPKNPSRRPQLGPVGRFPLYGLGVLAALKAVGLVLVAGAVASGIAGLMDGALDTQLIIYLGCTGAVLRGLAAWGTQVLARNIAIGAKTRLRAQLWARIANGDAEGADAGADPEDSEKPAARARISSSGESEGSVAVLATDGLDDLDDYYTNSLPAMIQMAVVPLIIGLRILGADWISALVIVLTIPLVPLFMVLIGKHTQARTDDAISALARLSNHMTELARGLPVLVGLNRVEEQARALDDIQNEYRAGTQTTLRWAFLSALVLELIATISVAIVAVFLGLRLLYGTVGLEAALLALILAPECFNALRELGSAFHSSQNGLSALQRVRTILSGSRRGDVRGAELRVAADITQVDSQPLTRTFVTHTGPPKDFPTLNEIASGKAWANDPTPEQEHEPVAVVVRDLTVHYVGRDEPVLDAFSADISGITAITGTSGAGKSTLLKALTGTLPADAEVSGWIVGVDHDQVAWAPQAPRSFTTTPWDEVALYGAKNPEASLREVGLSMVAESAIAELSPGELRRLAVARALARVDSGATLLVLDEPTAHLDTRSAERVRAAIRRRAERVTVVLATHEPETLALATRIVPVRQPKEHAASRAEEAATVAASATDAAPGPITDETEQIAPARPRPTTGAVGMPIITDAIRLAESAHTDTTRLPRLKGPRNLAFAPLKGSARPALWRILATAKGAWTRGVLLAFLTIAMGLSLTAISGWLIVRASVEEHIMYLLVAIVGVRFFGIGRAVSRYAERLVTHAAAFRVTDALRLRLWRSIAARGAGSRRLLEGGAPLDYLVTLTDELRDLLPRVIPPIGVGVLSIAGISVATNLVAPHLTLIVSFTLLIAGIAGVVLAILSARGAGRARIRARSALVRGTSALAAASDDLRGGGATTPALARLEMAGERLATAERRQARSAGAASAVVAFATSLLAVAVPLVSPGMPAELICVVALLALAAFEPLDALVSGAQRIPALREVVRRIAPLLDAPAPVSSGTASAPTPLDELRLDGVAATYSGRSEPVFLDATATVKTGEWLIVSGRSGSGKSTLLSVIMGAIPASSGAVRAAGVPLTDISPASWRARIAWCPQDAYVFDSTIRANLLLARSRDDAPSDSDMISVLRRAGLGALVASLPDGLDARVGSGGSALSGGERQRLAVARALLTRADVILLDEPTAHLDAPTAHDMMVDVREATADRIAVLVSHRPDDRVLANASAVIEL